MQDAFTLDAVTELAKSRGAWIGDAPVVSRVLVWTEHGRPRHRTITLPVVSTAQPFGGDRKWWQCPSPQCRRRCRFLLVPHPTGPIGCRRCLSARYLGDYPTRHQHRRLATLLTGLLASGAIDERAERAVDALIAKKRRGVRRGRRVRQRAIRLLAALPARLTEALDLLSAYDV